LITTPRHLQENTDAGVKRVRFAPKKSSRAFLEILRVAAVKLGKGRVGDPVVFHRRTSGPGEYLIEGIGNHLVPRSVCARTGQ
jgi:hypothetical protein